MSSLKDIQMNVSNFSPTSLEGSSLIWTMTLHYKRQAFVLKRLSLYRKEINTMAWPLSAYPFFPFSCEIPSHWVCILAHRTIEPKLGKQVTCLLFYSLLSPIISLFHPLPPFFLSFPIFVFFLFFFLSFFVFLAFLRNLVTKWKCKDKASQYWQQEIMCSNKWSLAQHF